MLTLHSKIFFSMTLLAYVYPHPTTPTPRKRKGWEGALLPLSLFWKPGGGGGSQLEGAATWLWTSMVGWVWIFSKTIKSTSLGIIYHSCIPKNKLHFFIRATTWGLGLQNTDQRFVWNCPPILDLFYCACLLEKMVRKVYLPCKLDGSVFTF